MIRSVNETWRPDCSIHHLRLDDWAKKLIMGYMTWTVGQASLWSYKRSVLCSKLQYFSDRTRLVWRVISRFAFLMLARKNQISGSSLGVCFALIDRIFKEIKWKVIEFSYKDLLSQREENFCIIQHYREVINCSYKKSLEMNQTVLLLLLLFLLSPD